MKLTPRQRKFVQAYDGNASAAARKAGYSRKTAPSQGQRLLKNVEVAKALKAREKRSTAKLIASREDRQAFWSQVMGERTFGMHDRLKASELLGKSEADFVERHEHSGTVTIHVVQPYAEGERE